MKVPGSPIYFGLVLTAGLYAQEYRAGAAKIDITPGAPMWLSGYASRTKPFSGVRRNLYARALFIEDRGGRRAVFVSTDLIGLPRQVTDLAAARLQASLQLDRAGIVFNSSHTHTGPMLSGNLEVMAPDDPAERARIEAYTRRVVDLLVQAVESAYQKREPSRLFFDYGRAGFAMNRREMKPGGVAIGVNRDGPVDHRVPVLKAVSKQGKTIALLFGYACHNTTLTGEFYEVSGDYAGEAAAAIEEDLAPAPALFFELCAGDQNPYPRSDASLIATHGKTLAAAALQVAHGRMPEVRGPVKSSYRTIPLPFAPHSREQFEEEVKSADRFRVLRARAMLARYDDRTVPRSLSYPVQVIRFAKGFTLVALAGEVVVDYALWCYREFPQERLMVAGYSNDVPCYIPNVRILREGGYEAETSMIYYGQPGRLSEEVEERIQEAIRAGIRRTRQ